LLRSVSSVISMAYGGFPLLVAFLCLLTRVERLVPALACFTLCESALDGFQSLSFIGRVKRMLA
jgi:hypothetical protein